MVTTIITAMAAYSNERVAAIILSVLYRMLTKGREAPFIVCNVLPLQCVVRKPPLVDSP